MDIYRKGIGIIFAMEEEIRPYATALGLVPGENLSGRKAWAAELDGIQCEAVVCGIGRTNAAMAAASLLLKGYGAVANIGSCGCTYKEPVFWNGAEFRPRIGEVWVPNTFLDGDFWLDSRGEMSRDPAGISLESGMESVVEPRIYTVSRFSTSPIEDGGYLVDMESYAIAGVCRAAGVPFKAFKTISDCADESGEDDFDRNLDKVMEESAVKVAGLLKEWAGKAAGQPS